MDRITAESVTELFTRADGAFLFARWGRLIAPVVFGVEAATLATLKGALEAVVTLAGHKMAETDPELGANLIVFFCREWSELSAVPNLERLIDGLGPLLARLEAAGANQYRVFRFDASGAIRACFVLIRVDAELASVSAETVALNQAVQTILLWSDSAFAGRSPLALAGDLAVLRPEVAAVIRTACDPVLPDAGRDPSLALRIAARAGAVQ